MHYEILVEDKSGKIALEKIVPRILPDNCSFKIHSYKGIGHIPKNLNSNLDPSKRVLLNHLPRLLQAYGRTFACYPDDYKACVIVVCDLDNRNFESFTEELNGILEVCEPRPLTRFCLCIEEGEAWLLGHKEAVGAAYPNAKKGILDAYKYDSICGTWEILADVVYDGGSSALMNMGGPEIGRMKSIWAAEISPLIDVEKNRSPSFQYFVRCLIDLHNKSA